MYGSKEYICIWDSSELSVQFRCEVKIVFKVTPVTLYANPKANLRSNICLKLLAFISV